MRLTQNEAKNYSKSYFFSTCLKRGTVEKWFDWKKILWSSKWKMYFLPNTAKLSFSVVLKHLRGKWLKTSLFGSKMELSQKEDEEYSEIIFFNKSEKGQILRKILILNGTTFFGQTSETGQILTKTVFLLKISHKQLLSFFAVLKFFHGNWLKNFHSLKKCDCFRLNLRITQKVIILKQVWKRENPEKIFDLMETTFFFGQTSEMGQILTITFYLLKMSHVQLN